MNNIAEAKYTKLLHELELQRSFYTLDYAITKKEISCAIKKLKNKKSEGPDCIKNEMLKYSQHVLTPVFVKLFNLILRSVKYTLGLE